MNNYIDRFNNKVELNQVIINDFYDHYLDIENKKRFNFLMKNDPDKAKKIVLDFFYYEVLKN